MELPTDVANRDEIHAYYTRQARALYQERVDLGHSATHARAQALAYLRRKTHWHEAFAAGMLDAELATSHNQS